MTDGHENEAQSPCKNLQGRPICSPQKISISRACEACETKLGCVLSFLENAIKNIGHHARLRGKDHRTCSTTRLPVTGNSHFEKERTDVFALSTISTLSLSLLFLPCHKFPALFPNHPFPKRPFFSRARKAAIIFCCQLRVIMRSTGCAVQLVWRTICIGAKIQLLNSML